MHSYVTNDYLLQKGLLKGVYRPVPPENRGRDFWQFLGKWQKNIAIFCIWQFGNFFAISCNFSCFVQFFMFLFLASLRSTFFLIHKKKKKMILYFKKKKIEIEKQIEIKKFFLRIQNIKNIINCDLEIFEKNDIFWQVLRKKWQFSSNF